MDDKGKSRFMIVERHERTISASVEAETKEEALAKWRRNDPSIVIMDKVIEPFSRKILMVIPV